LGLYTHKISPIFLTSIVKDSFSLQRSTPWGITRRMETNLAIPVTSVTHQPMDAITTDPDLPPWMQTPQLPTPDDPRPSHSPSSVALRHTTYANLFESALERVMGGTPLNTIVQNDPRGIQLGRFLYWINRDPTRRSRYEEACEVAAEALAHELVGIADAMDPNANPLMEDVQRSALRVKARTYLMEKWSPRRYGDTRRVQIDSTTLTANLTADDLSKMSLAELKQMAARTFAPQRDDTIDVTPSPSPMDEEAA